MTKYFITPEGRYVGAFDGALPPSGSIEIQSPPPDARMIWDGSTWTIPVDVKPVIVEEKRQDAYDAVGASLEDMVKALWEKVMNNKPEDAEAINVKVEAIKVEIPEAKKV